MSIDQVLGLILISAGIGSGFTMMISAIKELKRNGKLRRKTSTNDHAKKL